MYMMYMYLTTFFLHHLHLSCHTAVGTPPSVVSPRLAANAVGSPSFSYLEYRNCSAAVLIAEVSFSLSQLMRSAGGGCGRFVRLSSVSEGAVSYARARMIVSCARQAERRLQRFQLQPRRGLLSQQLWLG